jgi:hypothetical protein
LASSDTSTFHAILLHQAFQGNGFAAICLEILPIFEVFQVPQDCLSRNHLTGACPGHHHGSSGNKLE